jgi:NADPH:quinone reductase
VRAVEVTRFGGPEVLELVERPTPRQGDGEVVVEVAAAEVLFLDTQLRAGWGQEYFAMTPPFVPGAGVAGLLGEQRVIAGIGEVGTYPGGGYAEQVVVAETNVYPVPDHVDLLVALAALHDGPTALGLLDGAGVREGDRVLVNGAAGSLGHWLIPLLKAAGATVIAAARGDEKLDHTRKIGADFAVDYSLPGWPDQVLAATNGEELDVVFDGSGGDIGRSAFDLIARGGRFYAYGATTGGFASLDPTLADERGISLAGIHQPNPQDWKQLPARALEVLAEGLVQPTVGRTFELARAADAHTAIENRTTIGKTVLLTESVAGRRG